MATSLKGKHVAILVANGFEQSEMTSPRDALEKAGARTSIVSPESSSVKGWKHTEWGDEFPVDVLLAEAHAGEFDGVLLPGGLMNPDSLRTNQEALEFIRDIASMGKPIGAICHGPWILINAKLVRGRVMTSYPSIRQDLVNAGAQWIDEEVVIDRNFVTSRSPDDLPAFNQALVESFVQADQLVAEYTD